MKHIDLKKSASGLKAGKPRRTDQHAGSCTVQRSSAEVIQFHALLKNELKFYRGKSTKVRLGVLRKYEDLISRAGAK